MISENHRYVRRRHHVFVFVVMGYDSGMVSHMLCDKSHSECIPTFHDMGDVAFRSNQRLQRKQEHYQDEQCVLHMVRNSGS